MEVEKTFKCCDCEAKFPTPDLLTVHQRRHEMSLNLSLKPTPTSSLLTPSILNKGSLSAGILGFVDETPTPTRFIRNCEEVGLFQDLQNVNPFDEDFKKAANSGTGTPSVEGSAFDFSFSSSLSGGHGAPPTPTSSSFRNAMLRSKRRYSDQDSLNTPQVHFPYLSSSSGCHLQTLTTNTASMSACLTPTPQNSVISQESLRNVLQIETPTTPTTTYNHEEHASIIAYTSVISQQTNFAETNHEASPGIPLTSGFREIGSGSDPGKLAIKEKSSEADKIGRNQVSASAPKTAASSSSSSANAGHMGSRISLLKIRSKANLKLDLKTMDSKNNGSKSVIEKLSCRDSPSGATQSLDQSEGTSSEILGKGQGQSTKREILERKRAASYRSRERRKQWIDGLESRCRELEALLAQSQTEVVQLKAENQIMRSQLTRDSSKSEATQRKTSRTSSTIMVPMSNESSRNLPINHIHQSCQTELSGIPLGLQDRFGDVEETTCSTGNMKATVSPIQLPTLKAKRGRPRKGQERRVPVSSLSVISPSDEVNALPKIPILPLPNRR